MAEEIGESAEALPHDVADEARWREIVAHAVSQYGGLDVLVNNAGIVVRAHVEETSLELWRRIQSVNVEGVFLQDVQFDVLTDKALHLDFKRIDLDKSIRVEVDLMFIGHPTGASHGGHLVKDRVVFALDSLPAAVPEHIEVGVAEIDLGDKILASDLELPEGVTLVEGTENDVVCHMPATVKIEEEPVEDDAAAPEGGGETPEGGGDAKS